MSEYVKLALDPRYRCLLVVGFCLVQYHNVFHQHPTLTKSIIEQNGCEKVYRLLLTKNTYLFVLTVFLPLKLHFIEIEPKMLFGMTTFFTNTVWAFLANLGMNTF